MADFKNIILSLRNEKNFSQEQLAKELHVSKATIGMWETGKRFPGPVKYEEIADYFNVDMDYLYGRSEIRKNYHYDSSRKGEFFGLTVKGDSMLPSICDGDTVIVQRMSDTKSGDLVIALVNGSEATCKRLQKYADGLALIPNNPTYSPMRFTNQEIDETPVKILGKVVELRRKF